MHLNWMEFGGPLQTVRPFEVGLHLPQRVFLPHGGGLDLLAAGNFLGPAIFAPRRDRLDLDAAGASVQREVFRRVRRDLGLVALTDSTTIGGSGSGTTIPSTNDFRLTLTTGVAVTVSDVTGAGTLYMTPFIGKYIATYDSSVWTLHSSAEISLALTLTSGKLYDVFVYWTGSVLALELSAAWASDSSRTDALDYQDGIYVKSSDHSRRYMGTIRASGSNTTEDSETKRFVWNYRNRRLRSLVKTETTDNWTYTTATWRSANNSTANRVEVINGDATSLLDLALHVLAGNTNAALVAFAAGIGEDSTTTSDSEVKTRNRVSGTSGGKMIYGIMRRYPTLGYHYYQWTEYSEATGSTLWIGDNGETTFFASGLIGTWEA